MIVDITTKEIQEFESEIEADFKAKTIRSPVHLEDNNIPHIIEIFKEAKKGDWFVGNWRSHAECLCAGVPKDKLKEAIHQGRSISLCFKDYNVVCSAIVGGNVGIGLGLAFDIKRKSQGNHVWVFVGETTSMTGIFWEAYNYAQNWELPITFVVADNGKSVLTNTREVWNTEILWAEREFKEYQGLQVKNPYLYYYKYTLDYPHAGVSGGRIQF